MDFLPLTHLEKIELQYTPFTRVLVPLCGSWQRN